MENLSLVELFRKTISEVEPSEDWKALPARLRARGDWLKERSRIKDAELMYDAATEIEGLRQSQQ